MISGVVENDEGRVRLKVSGPHGREEEIDAVVDTGYTASLSLPPALVVTLDLRWQSVDRGTLADGSERLIDVYEAEVVWDGQVRPLLVDEIEVDPLVGMRLLRGHELRMAVIDSGKLTIERLS